MGTRATAEYKRRWLQGNIIAITKAGLIGDREKIISNFCLTHSSTRQTCLEILKNLEVAGIISINGNEIIAPLAKKELQEVTNEAEREFTSVVESS